MNFHVVSKSNTQIEVAHAEGHRYSYTVAETEDGTRILGDPIVTEGGRANYSAQHFLDEARRFAEDAARKAKLID